jgi:nitronate monooxygenase
MLKEADTEGGMWWAGQSQGLITSVKTCAEIVEEIMTEAERIIDQLGFHPSVRRRCTTAVMR